MLQSNQLKRTSISHAIWNEVKHFAGVIFALRLYCIQIWDGDKRGMCMCMVHSVLVSFCVSLSVQCPRSRSSDPTSILQPKVICSAGGNWPTYSQNIWERTRVKPRLSGHVRSQENVRNSEISVLMKHVPKTYCS